LLLLLLLLLLRRRFLPTASSLRRMKTIRVRASSSLVFSAQYRSLARSLAIQHYESTTDEAKSGMESTAPFARIV
jgi:hypothetical protein